MNAFLIFGIIALVALGFYLRWVTPRNVLRRLGARPLDQSPVLRNLRERLKELAHRQRVAMPTVWVMPEFAPNALVLRSRPRRLHLALTEGLIRSLSAEELDCALSLCLSHGYQRGRLLHTWAGMFFYPLAKLIRTYPLPVQILIAPALTALLRTTVRSARFVKADQAATLYQTRWAIAGTLQKLSVMGGKIPLRNWNLALDSLFLVSPLSLQDAPLWAFQAQPSMEHRRGILLDGISCESASSLT